MSPQRRSRPEPRFLLDRSLGRYIVRDALRAAGLDVLTLADHYGEQAAQRVSDEDWLALAGDNEWLVLLKDDAVRRRPAELAAIERAGVRAFCITNANLKGEQMAARYLVNIHRIRLAAQKSGPFIYGVYPLGIRRLWPDR